MKNLPKRIPGEKKYIDFDAEGETWDIVGEESGHVYCQFMHEKNAQEEHAQSIEMQAANRSYAADLGAGEWESFLTKTEAAQLIEYAKIGLGTWGAEKRGEEFFKHFIDIV